MGVYLSTPKTEKLSEDGENDKLKFGLSSMQGWRATMEDAHTALLDLDNDTAFFGVFDGHGGKLVAKFCAKYLHREVLRNEAYSAGDLGTAVQKAFFRMDEMMRGQRGWRELQALGDKINQFTGMIEGLIWSPRGSDSNDQHDDWAFEEGPHSDFAGPNCGSTACVAIVKNNQLVVANAGDSRCVISRNGQAYNLSRDHKPELEAERERILKAGGYIQMGRESSLSAVCERVLDRCLAPSTLGGEGCDNMTMILVQFKKPISQNTNASTAGQSASDTQPAGDTQQSVIQ
uniref:protein-serine/threonine phosphatase n=1 Tax=Leersia perrieri TaxID=77586 RepID=A0A0D9WSQ0_9ORYZ